MKIPFFGKARAEKIRKPKIKAALCLGGGGTRGFAHIGAIRAFEEAGIDFDFVAGTSVGSVVGALYCAGISSRVMLDHAHILRVKDIHSGPLWWAGDARKVGRMVESIIGEGKKLEDLPKKLVCMAVDLVSGQQEILETGYVRDVVSASSAVPVIFRPVVIGDKHLVDGGLLNNIPADIARMLGAEAVVTVDINHSRGGATKSLKTFDVARATLAIISANSSISGLVNSDIIINPDLTRYRASKKDGYEEMCELGYNAAKEKIDEIIKLMY